MGGSDELNTGKFEVVPGGLYGQRLGRRVDGRQGSRHHAPRDPQFTKRVAGIVATWRGRRCYASRAIANAAQEIVFPLSRIDRMMRDAVAADVPLERIEELGDAIKDRARELHARKRNMKPAA